MAEGSAEYHENIEALKPETVDRHRAIVSIMEELEAVNWYDQRVDAAQDEELAAILAHNRDEEKEHAAMLLEWLRRRDPLLDAHLRNYLFIERSVLEKEEELAKADEEGEAPNGGSLGVGSLREEVRR